MDWQKGEAMKPLRFTEKEIKQIAHLMLSNPMAQGFTPPFTLEMTDASGDTAKYTLSGDYEVSSQDSDKVLVDGCTVLLTDSTGKTFGSMNLKPMPPQTQ